MSKGRIVSFVKVVYSNIFYQPATLKVCSNFYIQIAQYVNVYCLSQQSICFIGKVTYAINLDLIRTFSAILPPIAVISISFKAIKIYLLLI